MRIVRTADDGEHRAIAEGTGQNMTGPGNSAEEYPWIGNNSDPQQERLLERVVEFGNMKLAWKQVKKNKGSYGIDGRSIAETELFLKERVNSVLRGWLQYFSLGLSLKQVRSLDFWIRRRFRCLIWSPTRVRKLLSLGIPQRKACYANNRKGPWWNSGMPVVTQALSPEYFKQLELYSMTDNLRELRITLT